MSGDTWDLADINNWDDDEPEPAPVRKLYDPKRPPPGHLRNSKQGSGVNRALWTIWRWTCFIQTHREVMNETDCRVMDRIMDWCSGRRWPGKPKANPSDQITLDTYRLAEWVGIPRTTLQQSLERLIRYRCLELVDPGVSIDPRRRKRDGLPGRAATYGLPAWPNPDLGRSQGRTTRRRVVEEVGGVSGLTTSRVVGVALGVQTAGGSPIGGRALPVRETAETSTAVNRSNDRLLTGTSVSGHISTEPSGGDPNESGPKVKSGVIQTRIEALLPADEWLAQLLGWGPFARSEAIALAVRAGYSEGTIKRAARRLGVVSEKAAVGGEGNCRPPRPLRTWRLP